SGRHAVGRYGSADTARWTAGTGRWNSARWHARGWTHRRWTHRRWTHRRWTHRRPADMRGPAPDGAARRGVLAGPGIGKVRHDVLGGGVAHDRLRPGGRGVMFPPHRRAKRLIEVHLGGHVEAPVPT